MIAPVDVVLKLDTMAVDWPSSVHVTCKHGDHPFCVTSCHFSEADSAGTVEVSVATRCFG